MADLGPCGVGSCTAEAVAWIGRTAGRSARLLVITGPRAIALADGPATADATRTVCHEHAAAALDDLLREAAVRSAPDHPQEPGEVELIELTQEEYDTALADSLAHLGCTYEELENMARTRDYASPDHRLLWLRIKPITEEGTRG